MLFIFDMGGVVTTTAGNDIYAGAARRIGVSKEELMNASQSMLYNLDTGRISVREYWKKIGEQLGKEINADWFRILFHPVLNEETVALIKDLKKMGHRVVCGTNTIESHYDNHLSRGDYAYFDMTYTSVHLGVRKPDPEFWKIIMEAEGFSPEETYFTDDRRENVDAAAALGIHSYQFDNASGFRKFIAGLKNCDIINV